MALFLIFERGHSYPIHIGEGKLPTTASKVTQIQADGDELDHCLRITGLPRHASVQFFTDPWIELIRANWK